MYGHDYDDPASPIMITVTPLIVIIRNSRHVAALHNSSQEPQLKLNEFLD